MNQHAIFRCPYSNMLRTQYNMHIYHKTTSHQTTTQIRITTFNKVSLSGNPRYMASNKRINPNNHVIHFSNCFPIPIRSPSKQNTKPYKFLFYQSLKIKTLELHVFYRFSHSLTMYSPDQHISIINHHPLHIMHQLEILKHKKFPLQATYEQDMNFSTIDSSQHVIIPYLACSKHHNTLITTRTQFQTLTSQKVSSLGNS